MDGDRFDAFTKRLVALPSRRQVVKGLGGGLAAGLLGLGEAVAAPPLRPNGRRCRSDSQCASGYRDPVTGRCIAAPTVQTGELTRRDPTFTRCGFPEDDFRYDTFTYTHSGGPLSISLRGADSGGGTLQDPYVYLYSSFDPDDPCANLVGESDDNNCSLDSYLSLTELAAGTYTIVATSFNPEATGTYTLETNTPPPC